MQVRRTVSRLPRPLTYVAILSVVILAQTGATAAPNPAAELGEFSPPFTEPEINGQPTEEKCVPHDHANGHQDGEWPSEHDEDHAFDCKPAAGSVAALPNGEVLYWNALEGTENVKAGIVAEFGDVSVNDQGRVLDLRGSKPTWTKPAPLDGGATGEINPLIPGANSTETYNDGALFCSDLNYLPDGRLLVAGGTAYYNDPGNDALPVGAGELEGLKVVRIFDPETSRWTQTGDMGFGRWYPTMVTLGNGDTFIASGVQKLVKTVYPDHPEDSGRNVVETETYDPDTGEWTYNGESADRSLPLFPRLHLLPNGDVYYNAAGQVFNPNGYSYDEPLWNLAASYDTESKTWTDLGIPGIGTLHPGFRGSSFSIMLPLEPNEDGEYVTAEFLSAGGVMGTSPGGYVATPFSAITTVDTSNDNAIATRATGDLNEPRWYSSGVALPTGEVLAFSGADRDEVVAPGLGFPVNRAELFDPETETWLPLASSQQLRTYHNTATLLPDGRVLVGGHAPISTLYGNNTTVPGGFSPQDGRDPSFEIFSPPYLFRGDRPSIIVAEGAFDYGAHTTMVVDDASDIESVVLVRNTSVTHLVDGDQRVVELPILKRDGRALRVATPPTGDIAPPGPYMLFVNRAGDDGLVPSVSRQVTVGR
ncbi:MAG: galactose oxidase-like domain-containing protein [Actinomycetota bacterium]